MFAIMAPPIFVGDGHAMHRPSASSPLASSPICARSPPSSPRGSDALPYRETQSSPVPAPKFRFATRPARPNPLLRRREDAQESRRTLFLKNARQRRDDWRWEQRGGDQELLKLEWQTLNSEWRQAKEAEAQGVVADSEINDVEQLWSEPAPDAIDPPVDLDDMMVDALERETEEVMKDSLAEDTGMSNARRPNSLHLSDDEDYDALFMDFLAQESRCDGFGSVDSMETC